MRTLLLLGVLCLTVTIVAAQPSGPSISIMGDGTLVIQGSAEVRRYSADGRWAEGTPRSSARNAVRHFRFLAPNGPPAIELYVTRDLTNAPPDGAFEIGLVNGFLSSFGAGAGFRPSALVVEEAMVGAAAVKRCRAELTKGGQTLWLYAYIFPRNPTLTFLTLRPQSDARPSIEGYLGGVRLRRPGDAPVRRRDPEMSADPSLPSFSSSFPIGEFSRPVGLCPKLCLPRAHSG